jgi:FlaA1/EpsC-like NDP-sugar epimerase
MKKIKNVFQYLSYLQYPLGILMLFYAYKPLIFGMETFWSDVNTMLVLMGLAVSFSTLQDTTKVQNKISQKIWENPKYANAFLIYLAIMTFLILSFGAFGYFISDNENIQTVALGAFVLGIGLIGMLKMAIEMAEYQQQKQED